MMFCIQSRERIERERKKSARFRRLNRRTQSECSPSKHNLPGTNTSCFSPAFDDDDDKATTSSKDFVSSRIVYYVCGVGVCKKVIDVLKCSLDFRSKISLSLSLFWTMCPLCLSQMYHSEEKKKTTSLFGRRGVKSVKNNNSLFFTGTETNRTAGRFCSR